MEGGLAKSVGFWYDETAGPAPLLPIKGKEVIPLEEVKSFLISVVAGIVSFYVCKLFDRSHKDR